MNKNKLAEGLFFSILSAATWGSYGVFSTILLRKGIEDSYVSFLACFTIFVYFTFVVWRKREVIRETAVKDMIAVIILMGVINLGANYTSVRAYYYGMPTSAVATAAFCNVFFVLIGSALFLHNKITLKKFFISIMAFAGVALTLGGIDMGSGDINPLGIIWTCLIPLFFASSILLNKYYIEKGMDPELVMVLLGIGSVFQTSVMFRITPAAFFADIAEAAGNDITVLFCIAGFCFIPEIICYASQQQALKRISPEIFSICYAVDPVVATILGFIAFRQTISAVQLAGMVIVLSAVCLLNISEVREKHLNNLS